MSELMTIELLKQALPKALVGNANQEFADRINGIAQDPDLAREIRSNFLTFSKVLTEGKYKTDDYLSAVQYCTFKLMGYTNKDSYAKTFPDRYTALNARGASDKDISAYVAGYHKNKLVNTILEQAMVPMWLLNQDVYQRAINTQLVLMTDPEVSPKVRSDAANSILTHLKAPEVKKVELDVNVKGQGGIMELSETMTRLAAQQLDLIQQGGGVQAVSRLPVIVSEAIDAEFQDVGAPAAQAEHPQDAMQRLLRETAHVEIDEPTPAPPLGVATPEMQGPDWQGPHTGPAPETVPLSLFAQPAKAQGMSTLATAPAKPEFKIQAPAVNWAECCTGLLEDCMCGDAAVHVYLPTAVERGPRAPTKSLFASQPFGKDD